MQYVAHKIMVPGLQVRLQHTVNTLMDIHTPLTRQPGWLVNGYVVKLLLDDHLLEPLSLLSHLV